jgi:hypothetical protein
MLVILQWKSESYEQNKMSTNRQTDYKLWTDTPIIIFPLSGEFAFKENMILP